VKGLFTRFREFFRERAFRTVIALSVFFTVMLALVAAGFLFYKNAARELEGTYKQYINQRLRLVNAEIEQQIALINTGFSLIAANATIRDNLDPATAVYHSKTAEERHAAIDRQLANFTVINYLWSKNAVNSVYIFVDNEVVASFSLAELGNETGLSTALSEQDKRTPPYLAHVPAYKELAIDIPVSRPASIFFSRNIYNRDGELLGRTLIDARRKEWIESFSLDLDSGWKAVMFDERDAVLWNHSEIELASTQEVDKDIIKLGQDGSVGLLTYRGVKYYYTAGPLEKTGLRTGVAAPRQYLLQELAERLDLLVLIYVGISLVTLAVSVLFR
jgi:hypothetical protein